LLANKASAEKATLEEKTELNALKSILKMLKEYEDKSNPLFFGRIIHAIVSDPKNPCKALKNFTIVSSDEWVKRNNIKIAMIGDRYDKDIRPLINLLGKRNVITIHYRKGKHGKSFLPHSIAPSQKPDLTENSFRKIQKFLLTDEVWQKTRMIKSPPKFINIPLKTISYFRQATISSKQGIIEKIGQFVKQGKTIKTIRKKGNCYGLQTES
jgi:hypothetical protein